jgi:hypothetical protein
LLKTEERKVMIYFSSFAEEERKLSVRGDESKAEAPRGRQDVLCLSRRVERYLLTASESENKYYHIVTPASYYGQAMELQLLTTFFPIQQLVTSAGEHGSQQANLSCQVYA